MTCLSSGQKMDRLTFTTENELHLTQFIDFESDKVTLEIIDNMLETFCHEVRHYYFLKEHG